jgi:hypothetical protein
MVGLAVHDLLDGPGYGLVVDDEVVGLQQIDEVARRFLFVPIACGMSHAQRGRHEDQKGDQDPFHIRLPICLCRKVFKGFFEVFFAEVMKP